MQVCVGTLFANIIATENENFIECVSFSLGEMSSFISEYFIDLLFICNIIKESAENNNSLF